MRLPRTGKQSVLGTSGKCSANLSAALVARGTEQQEGEVWITEVQALIGLLSWYGVTLISCQRDSVGKFGLKLKAVPFPVNFW